MEQAIITDKKWLYPWVEKYWPEGKSFVDMHESRQILKLLLGRIPLGDRFRQQEKCAKEDLVSLLHTYVTYPNTRNDPLCQYINS